MKSLPRIGAVGASLALAAAAVGFAVSPAGATAVDVETPLVTPPSGLTLTMAGTDNFLPAATGSSFAGTYDDDTGELNGEVTIAPGSFAITDPLPADVYYSFDSGGPIVGGHIASDNSVSFTDSQTLNLRQVGDPPILDFGDDCSFGPIEIDYHGTYDPATNLVDVESDPIAVPPVTGDCGGQATLIGGLLDGAEVSAHLQFELAVNDVPEVPTTVVTPTTEAPTTAAPTTVAPTTTTRKSTPTSHPATPVAATPSYTG